MRADPFAVPLILVAILLIFPCDANGSRARAPPTVRRFTPIRSFGIPTDPVPFLAQDAELYGHVDEVGKQWDEAAASEKPSAAVDATKSPEPNSTSAPEPPKSTASSVTSKSSTPKPPTSTRRSRHTLSPEVVAAVGKHRHIFTHFSPTPPPPANEDSNSTLEETTTEPMEPIEVDGEPVVVGVHIRLPGEEPKRTGGSRGPAESAEPLESQKPQRPPSRPIEAEKPKPKKKPKQPEEEMEGERTIVEIYAIGGITMEAVVRDGIYEIPLTVGDGGPRNDLRSGFVTHHVQLELTSASTWLPTNGCLQRHSASERKLFKCADYGLYVPSWAAKASKNPLRQRVDHSAGRYVLGKYYNESVAVGEEEDHLLINHAFRLLAATELVGMSVVGQLGMGPDAPLYQHLIQSNLSGSFATAFPPLTDGHSASGRVTFGQSTSPDNALCMDQPATRLRAHPTATDWRFDVQSFEYRPQSTPGITFTGSLAILDATQTELHLPVRIVSRILSHLSAESSRLETLRIDCDVRFEVGVVIEHREFAIPDSNLKGPPDINGKCTLKLRALSLDGDQTAILGIPFFQSFCLRFDVGPESERRPWERGERYLEVFAQR